MTKARPSSRGDMDLKQKRISNFFASKPASQSVALPKVNASAAATPKETPKKRSPAKQQGAANNTTPGAVRRSPRSSKDDQNTAAPGTESPFGKAIVGQRISVWWPVDQRWYSGYVEAYNSQDDKHKVHYDDDEEEWLTLKNEKIQLNDQATAPANITAKHEADSPSGKAIVGQRISVWWPMDKKWFSGYVEDYNPQDDKHKVHYDDDEVEWLLLKNEKIQLSDQATTPNGKQLSPAKPKKASPKSVKRSQPAAPVAKKTSRKRLQQPVGKAADDEDVDLELMDDVEDVEVDDDNDEEFVVEDESEEEDQIELEEEVEDDEDEDHAVKKKRNSGSKKARVSGSKRVAVQTPSAPGSAGKKMRTENGAGRDVEMANGPMTAASDKAPAPVIIHRSISQKGRTELLSKLDPMHGAVAAKDQAASAKFMGVSTNITADGERFMARFMDSKYEFLRPENIRDGNGRRPNDPDYNPRTVRLPNKFFDGMSPGQTQWWQFKAQNFDSVLLFKVGKFYEMFEMDSFVGVDVLGLQFMSGDKPHAGFPEMAYSQMAESLARAGYRVVVIEQTETPAQLAAANKASKGKAKARSVVNRDKVAVLSKGTLMDAEMVASHPEASYAVAIWEQPVEEEGKLDVVNIGLCAVDVAAGQLLLGGWTDDEMRGGLRTHLASLQPVEVILPKQGLSATSSSVLKASLNSPQTNHLKGEDGNWSFEQVEQFIKSEKYFEANANVLPEVLQTLLDTGSVAAVTSLCGMMKFLREAILDKVVLPLGRISLLPDTKVCDHPAGGKFQFPVHMNLNAAALENLEVLQNSEGGTHGTLMQILDYCKTPFGRRKLKQWLTRPLARVRDIKARQAAVKALIDAESEVVACRKELNGVSDVERAVARLQAKAVCGGVGREAPNVVLYEDVAKKNVIALRGAIMDLKAISAAIHALQQADLQQSNVLASLLDANFWDAMRQKLQSMEDAADWNEAAQSGRVVPKREPGTPYDEACTRHEEVESHIQEYLKDVQRATGCKTAKYVTVNKEEQIEVPDTVKVNGNFSLASQKKGFKRYVSDELRALCRQRQDSKTDVEDALSNALSDLVKKFASSNDIWVDAVDRVARLDALLSLVGAAMNGDGEMCCPEVVEPEDAPNGPFFSAKDLRHPASIIARGGAFVPNDVELGGNAASMLLLTGPNMGGKSTLLRQVCCAVLLAQVGGWVPASSMRFTPVDAIFVRMGARDHIVNGLSTFFIELSETATMLQHATQHSLVALDELGRGTATSDGAAIAGAVLEHMTRRKKCRGLFATHYHYLAKDHDNDPDVYVAHMGCAVDPGQGGRLPQLTFLYKLTPGACPKSYGTNVAQLAGLPESVLLRAADMSATYEQGDTLQAQLMSSLSEAVRIAAGK